MRPRVEQADELLLALGTRVLDEVEQLGVGLGGVGPVAEHATEVVEVGGVEGRTDLVDALEVVGDPAEADAARSRRRPAPDASRRPSTRCRNAGAWRLGARRPGSATGSSW